MAAQMLETEIAIIGGGLGGVAAALAAAEAGRHVIMTEPTDWIGGQVTSQAVSALDEHQYIETFGGTRAYYRFREGVRDWYRAHYPAVNSFQGANIPGEDAAGQQLNPGGGWVSRLCFEPRVGLEVLQGLLAPHVAAGRLHILLRHTPTAAERRAGRIHSVTLLGPDEAQVTLRAEIFLDASELGDLLPLAGVPYVTGAEAIEDTGEPHASMKGPQAARVQSFTWCFVVEHCPGEKHVIRKPYGYEYYRQAQPFSLVLPGQQGSVRRFSMFEGELPFWEYRRVFHAGLLEPGSFAGAEQPARDRALINWDSNDYYKENLIDRSPAQQERILREARRLSLSFLYWLQTEVPHNGDEGRGYPGLRLVPEATGTPDGLAKAPYIRESRRILGFRRILEQEITAPVDEQPERGARAAHYTDTVGIGWYPVDLHRCAGDLPEYRETRVEYDPSQPFQVPLGAMISPAVDNLLAAAKNIATTHITNGAYRLHPVEWAIGEAAGALAAACVAERIRPQLVWETPDRLRAFQKSLLARGIPLVWTVDVPAQDPDFIAIQSCLLNGAYSPGMSEAGGRDALVEGILPRSSPRRERLEALPDEPLSRPEGAWLVERLPRSYHNLYLPGLARAWQQGPPGPFTGKDWLATCTALGLPTPEGMESPTLRRVCQALVQFI